MRAAQLSEEYNLDGDDPVDGFPQAIPAVLESLAQHGVIEGTGVEGARLYSLSSFGRRFAEDAGRCMWSLGPVELERFGEALANDGGSLANGLPSFSDLESALRQLLSFVASDLSSDRAVVISTQALERGAVRALDLPVSRQLKLFEVWTTFDEEHIRSSLFEGLWVGIHRARVSPGQVDTMVVDLIAARGCHDRAPSIRASAGLLIKTLRAAPRNR